MALIEWRIRSLLIGLNGKNLDWVGITVTRPGRLFWSETGMIHLAYEGFALCRRNIRGGRVFEGFQAEVTCKNCLAVMEQAWL